MILPPSQPATKSARFSFILEVRLGLIQISARGEETQQALDQPKLKLLVELLV